MEKNILLVIEYDGTGFHGWQKQPSGVRTVQGELEYVLRYIAGKEISINGTSRTDSGVHAHGQCASFRWDVPIPTEKLPEIINRRFGAGGIGRSGAPGDVRIISATEVDDDFHARFSCVGKTYRYVIDRSGDIFNRHHAYLFAEPLDIDAMRAAAEHVIGTHDFKSFETAGGTPRETTVRTVTDVRIVQQDNYRTEIFVTGDGFLYNMVRIMVGTLVETGLGKREPSCMRDTIAACDRRMAGFTAPPQGLYLEKIYFDEEEFREGI